MLSIASLALPSQAQDLGNPNLSARDAFGERLGEEQIGLYDEDEVRGFDLGDTGAYRVDGAFFIREFKIPDAVLEGVRVNVGINAARMLYPSPSGVVDYRLKTPSPGDHEVTFMSGVRGYGSVFSEVSWSYSNEEGSIGVAGGAQYIPRRRWEDKRRGHTSNFGLVPKWRPSDGITLRGVFVVEESKYNGNFRFQGAGDTVPPKLPSRSFALPWAINDRFSTTAGALIDVHPLSDWSFSGSMFFSENKRSPQDFTFLSVNPDRSANVRFLRAVKRRARSLTMEASLARSFKTNAIDYVLTLSFRNRDSKELIRSITPIDVGLFNLDTRLRAEEPNFGVVTNGSDSDIDQKITSVSYVGSILDGLELRGALHHVDYASTATPFAGRQSEQQQVTWAYNASLVWPMNDQTSLFGNVVKGVEDSGTAPQNATNRNEVLPPVTAKSIELGLRREIRGSVSFVLSAFQVEKEFVGLRPDGVYAPLGDVRHRGIEVSLSGPLSDSTSLILGGMAMKPSVTGEFVDRALFSNRPVGISSTLAVASIDHHLTSAPDWSIDGKITWRGPRAANAANSSRAPGKVSFSVGTRYNFSVAGHPATMRMFASNLFTTRPWTVKPTGLFEPGEPFTVRLNVRIRLTAS